VLKEIDLLDGDYVKAHYANLLMKLPVAAKEYASIVTAFRPNSIRIIISLNF
jgi:hypothetical protein